MVLAFGFCEREAGEYYASIGVIDADGTWLGTRRKNPLSPGTYGLESFTQITWPAARSQHRKIVWNLGRKAERERADDLRRGGYASRALSGSSRRSAKSSSPTEIRISPSPIPCAARSAAS